MRALYFDLDGTLIGLGTGKPKPALLAGRFEGAVRAAAFDEIVCVGSFVGVIHQLEQVYPDYDGPGAILKLCDGAIRDEPWFRLTLRLARDPWNRGAEIPLDGDWWYVDDLAGEFMRRAGRGEEFRAEAGRRILVPDPDGDGEDILRWLEGAGKP